MLVQSLKRQLAYALLGIYGLRYRKHAAPLDRLFWLRQLAGHEKDVLAAPLNRTKSTGKSLNNHFLARVLAGDELGTWALDAEVLNSFEREIRLRCPKAVLEFGCGVSTICLARYMQEIHKQDDILRVYSIEQDSHYAQQVMNRLSDLKLNQVVRIIHAPLQKQVLEGIETVCYQLPTEFESLLNRCPDFIVIDGPAGDDGVRFGTLPLVRQYLAEEAIFFLDDALRDGELQIGFHWSNLPYLRVFGMYLCGKGLLAGCVRNR